jgi:hypothetical protein
MSPPALSSTAVHFSSIARDQRAWLVTWELQAGGVVT